MRRTSVLCIALLAFWIAPNALADGPPQFQADIAPLFKEKCVKCHGPAKAEGGLNLSLASAAAKGGKNGALLQPHDVENSLLWERVSTDEMPPKHPLNASEKERIKRWIESGASGLTGGSGESNAADHWAFRKLSRPALPSNLAKERAVDYFFRLRTAKPEPSDFVEAPRPRLIRRVSLSLTGLPPTPDEIDVFVKDDRPGAYGRMIDRYLASPRYGERWGKLWLDAAGYADSNGYFNADSERPLAYRYRDYVIKSLNEDRPFDRFIREQLAGDEMGGFTPDQPVTPEVLDRLIATHFLRNGQDGSGESDGNPDEVRVDRYTALESSQQIIASSLLEQTIQCAKCHAHKFEPITHEDYYRFQAILYPVFPAADDKLWIKPNARFVLAPLAGEKEAWDKEVATLEANVKAKKTEVAEWHRANRLQGEVLFADDFNSASSLSANWTNTAPGDDAPGGKPPVAIDSDSPPAAKIDKGRLAILAGKTLDSWLVTRQSFDWTPEKEGEALQVTFDLVATKSKAGAASAERIGYFIAAHDFDDSGKIAGGNILIDGNPSAATQVHLDYPGRDSVSKGAIGQSGYTKGKNYGVRIVNAGKGRFRLEHLVDGAIDAGSIELSEADLPIGAFGFEYHAERGFIVDNVRVERFASKLPTSHDRLAKFEKEYGERRKSLDAVEKQLKELRNNPPGKISWATDVTSTPPETHLLARGNYAKPTDVMSASPLSVLADAPITFTKQKTIANARTTGRRLAFANWITDRNNRAAALMARVQVNRVWQAYFGSGIVTTPENLGLSGAPPTHPELLEWLAAEFVESGWSMKHLHRLILESIAFRRADFSATRLDAESIRDAMLAVSGDLDTTMYGASIPFQTAADGAVIVGESQPGGHRRSIYLRSRRTQVISLLQVFDTPSIVFNSLRRPRTAMPLQSLALLNSGFVHARAISFASRLERDRPDEAKRIVRSFQLAFGREPSAQEVTGANKFLNAQTNEYGKQPDTRKKAWADYCHALLVSNEFLYVD